MVVLGRPKSDLLQAAALRYRKSYRQWLEDNIAPQVVFEVRSESDTQTKMDKKLVFYNRYGVEEYYLYDPQDRDLSGWLRTEGLLDVIEPMLGWVSPRLGLRFELGEQGLELYAPNGEKFVDYVELYQQREQERQQKELAQQRAERLAAQLRAAGIEPEV